MRGREKASRREARRGGEEVRRRMKERTKETERGEEALEGDNGIKNTMGEGKNMTRKIKRR